MLHLNSIDLKCIKGGSNVTIAPIAALGTAWIVTLVILAILIVLLVIDKKRMKISEANLPKVVIDNVPKMMRRSKVPIVKAKVGPRIMTFMCDEKVFDMIPVKQEIRAMVGGIYILSVKSLRGPALVTPPKKTFWQKVKGKFSKAE